MLDKTFIILLEVVPPVIPGQVLLEHEAEMDCVFSAGKLVQFADHGGEDLEEGDFCIGIEVAVDHCSVVLAQEVTNHVDVPLVLTVQDFRQPAVHGLDEGAAVV